LSPGPKLILDFDGTIAALGVDWGALRARIEEAYGPIGPRTIFSWLLERAEEGLDISGPLELIKEAELEALKALDFDGELVGLLRALGERGARLALVSLQDDEVLRRALEAMGASGLFDIVVGRATELSRERQVRRVLEHWGALPGDVIFISDRTDDVELGLKLGLRALRLAYRDGSVLSWLRGLLRGIK